VLFAFQGVVEFRRSAGIPQKSSKLLPMDAGSQRAKSWGFRRSEFGSDPEGRTFASPTDPLVATTGRWPLRPQP